MIIIFIRGRVNTSMPVSQQAGRVRLTPIGLPKVTSRRHGRASWEAWRCTQGSRLARRPANNLRDAHVVGRHNRVGDWTAITNPPLHVGRVRVMIRVSIINPVAGVQGWLVTSCP